MPTNNITEEEIAEFFKKEENFLLLCHTRPDGDTLGSALALKRGLEAMGKRAKLFCAQEPFANTEFLFGEEEWPAFDKEEEDGDGTVVSVDVASEGLLGSLEGVFGGTVKLKIDHHETGDDFAEYNFTDPSAAACGEVIYRILKRLGVPLADAAEPLYAAISSDTGGFRYSNTTAQTHRIAAELLDAGADNAFIDHMLYENRTQGEIRALTAAYGSMRFFLDGQVAAVTITNDDKRRLNLREEDLGEISSITREIRGVQVGITLRQEKHDASRFKLSVRSEPGFPANELCAIFGGGGHPCAAGAELSAANGKVALATVLKHLADGGEEGVKIV